MARKRTTTNRNSRAGLFDFRLMLFMFVIGFAGVLLVGFAAFGGGDVLEEAQRSSRLPQEFTARSGVSFRYPKNWVIQEVEGTTYVANRQEALDTDIQPGDFQIAILPPFPRSLWDREGNMSMQQILDAVVQSWAAAGSRVISPAAETTVGDKPAARAAITSDTSEGFALAIQLADNYLVVMQATGAIGTLADNEAKARDIAETIRYEPPAAPVTPTVIVTPIVITATPPPQ